MNDDNQSNAIKRFNFNHKCNDFCACKKNIITRSRSNEMITLFSMRNYDDLYELKYNTSRYELALVVTNSCTPHVIENVILSCNADETTPCPGKPVKGNKGQKGEMGTESRGQKGDSGEQGQKGSKGQTGDFGEIGPKGAKGCPGDPGTNGQKGDRGHAGLGFRFVGKYDPCKKYHRNDVVRLECDNKSPAGIYIYTGTTGATDHMVGWKLMLQDGTCTNNSITSLSCPSTPSQYIIESYNQESFNSSDFEKNIVEKLNHKSEFSKSIPFAMINEPKSSYGYYYAYKETDINYSLVTSKRQKWSVPIIFEKVLEIGTPYNNNKNQIVFKNPGIYKITIHINFIGTTLFKTSAYLLKPTDDPCSNIYQKNRKIPSSKMTLFSGDPFVKLHLHYCFVAKVTEPMSTLVIMSEHRHSKHSNDEKEIIIFGKEKTWILIEKIK